MSNWALAVPEPKAVTEMARPGIERGRVSLIARAAASLVFYVVPAAVAIALALPLAVSLGPWSWRDEGSAFWRGVGLAPLALVGAGILAAPGYVYAWLNRPLSAEMSAGLRTWLRFSLIAALSCGMLGSITGYWMPLMWPPSLLSALGATRLLHDLRAGGPGSPV